MSSICIIPARGGSQRIPRKNIKSFLGKPILAYSILAALESRLFDEVMVSTDDAEIADVAKKYGAKVPFLRSVANSNGHATLADALLEVLGCYNDQGKTFDHVCCILPTAPLIRSDRLVETYGHFNSTEADSLCPVVAFSYPIKRALEITPEGKLKMIWPEYLSTRSQDLAPAYHDSGSFYWIRSSALLKEQTLFCKNGSAFILEETEIQDIDTESDWKMAELKYTLLNG